MLALEAQLHIHFMHPNWSLLKKPWTGAVTNSVTPRDFARALTVLKCCIKPILMLGVWKEGQGHTRFSRITHQVGKQAKGTSCFKLFLVQARVRIFFLRKNT